MIQFLWIFSLLSMIWSSAANKKINTRKPYRNSHVIKFSFFAHLGINRSNLITITYPLNSTSKPDTIGPVDLTRHVLLNSIWNRYWKKLNSNEYIYTCISCSQIFYCIPSSLTHNSPLSFIHHRLIHIPHFTHYYLLLRSS